MWDRLFWNDRPDFSEAEIRAHTYLTMAVLLIVIPLLPLKPHQDDGAKIVLAGVATIVGRGIARVWGRYKGVPFVPVAEAKLRYRSAQQPSQHRLVTALLIGLGVSELYPGHYPWRFQNADWALAAVIAVAVSVVFWRMAISAQSSLRPS